MPQPVTAQRTVPRAEHVGSLLRPPDLAEAVQAQVQSGEIGASLDIHGARDLRELTDEHIRRVVERQESIGLDVVTDGEFGRILFTDSFYGAVQGFELTDEKAVFHDDSGGEIAVPFAPAAARRLELTGNPLISEVGLLSSLTDRRFKVTLPAASIGCAAETYRPDLSGDAYKDADDLAHHIARLERELIDAAVAEGASYVQLDFPLYPYLVDPHQRDRLRDQGQDPEALLTRFLAADRAVIKGLPDDVLTSLHICRGNLKSKWLYEGSLEPVAERMFGELPYQRFLLEMDDLGREDDFSILRHVPQGTDGPVVVLGLVSSKKPELEDEDELLRAIEEAGAFLPVEQLALSPQCGFASNVQGNELTEDDQWRKLELIARVADRVW